MEATYTIQVLGGRTVEMTGPLDALDKITMQMQTHSDLLAACQAFVEAWEKSLQLEKTATALTMAKIAIEKATQ